MAIDTPALSLLEQEARALLTRLARVRSFALHETMVPAAALTLDAQMAIERYLAEGRRALRGLVGRYLSWLHGPAARAATPAEAQRRFTFLRLRFNAVLAHFDIFADVITQRSEHRTGVWLAGLDVAAADALALPDYFEPPPLACYLDRGHGAAIRRARTRLPGGGENPVAVIRVPRERMVGSGIASSLVHEVGHQGAAMLDLVDSLRPELRAMQEGDRRQRAVWACWERWISEIVADFWAVARVGVAATTGLLAVVSLPRVFVFKVRLDDPHPSPWIRVRLSAAIGAALYPDPQWARLSRIWEAFYPTSGLEPAHRALLHDLDAGIPAFVELLLGHRPASLRGRRLGAALASPDRRPEHLRDLFASWTERPALARRAPPALVFAALGQARADNRLSPELESHMLGELLKYWALRATLDRGEICAAPTPGARRRPTNLPALVS
ncbi:MAG TPA: hypothetical protein PKD53_06145 [Chloroflexaceae bacterium]|mgnify:CR=1 FL=1|nr:hypothetical protein [Chloroflexaceae bacterium]